MGLKTMSLLSGATLSATGGTAMAFADDGAMVPNGLHVIVPATADMRVRENATFRNRAAKYDPVTGLYSKAKTSVSLAIPAILADGSTTFNLIRIEIEVHPECQATVLPKLRTLGAQLLFDSDVEAFWTTGSLS